VQTIDGKSILPFLKNPNRKDDNKILLWHYPNNWTNVNNHGISWGTALRKGNWKLIYFHKTGELELYDLSKDIGEEHDLAKAQPAKLREMASLMTKTLKNRNASMPTFKQNGMQIPWPEESLQHLLNSQ
jgi:arylsulfatase A-like enzyme